MRSALRCFDRRFEEAHEAFARAAFLSPESPACLVSLGAARARLALWTEEQRFGGDARCGGTYDFADTRDGGGDTRSGQGRVARAGVLAAAQQNVSRRHGR